MNQRFNVQFRYTIIIFIIFSVSTYLFTLTIKELYISKAKVTCVPSYAYDPTILFNENIEKINIDIKSDFSILYAIASSKNTLYQVINNLNLYNHYEVDSNSVDSFDKISANIKIERDRDLDNVLIIQTIAKNPQMAKRIADEVILQTSIMIRNNNKHKNIQIHNSLLSRLISLEEIIVQLNDSIKKNKAHTNEDYFFLKNQIVELNSTLNKVKIEKILMESSLNNNLATVAILEAPSEIKKPEHPKRVFISLFSGIVGCLMYLIVLLIKTTIA